MNDLIKSVHTLILFTSGQCAVLNSEGEQIELPCLAIHGTRENLPLFKQCVEQATRLFISHRFEWARELTKEQFIKITHLDCLKGNQND